MRHLAGAREPLPNEGIGGDGSHVCGDALTQLGRHAAPTEQAAVAFVG